MFGFKFPWTKWREQRELREAIERSNKRAAQRKVQREQDQAIEFKHPVMDDGSQFPLPIVHYPAPGRDASEKVALGHPWSGEGGSYHGGWSGWSADPAPECDSSSTSDKGSSE